MFDKMKSSAESYGVIGLGRFGTALVKKLSDAGKEVIAVDKDEAKVKAVRGWTDYAFVIDELNEAALKETGMQNCGTVTICIGERIDISILTTMLVTKLGVPHVISKAASEVHGEVLKQLGAEVVYPEADMAVRIGKRLISGNLLDYVALGDGVEVRRIAVGGKMLGKSVRELDLRKVYGINVIAVEHARQTNVEFSADYTFKDGDVMAVVGKVAKIDRFEKEIMQYLSIDPMHFPEASKCFEQPMMDREYFMHLADRFRSPHIWKWEDGMWKLRHTPYEGDSEVLWGDPRGTHHNG